MSLKRLNMFKNIQNLHITNFFVFVWIHIHQQFSTPPNSLPDWAPSIISSNIINCSCWCRVNREDTCCSCWCCCCNYWGCWYCCCCWSCRFYWGCWANGNGACCFCWGCWANGNGACWCCCARLVAPRSCRAASSKSLSST